MGPTACLHVLPPPLSPSLSSANPVILFFVPRHPLKQGGLHLLRTVLETVTCACMQMFRSAPDTAQPVGSRDSQGPTCPLDLLSLQRQGTRRPLQDKAPGPEAGCSPFSSLLPGAQGPSAGISCLGPGRWAFVWVVFPAWSTGVVLFLKPSLSVCLAQNVAGAPG